MFHFYNQKRMVGSLFLIGAIFLSTSSISFASTRFSIVAGANYSLPDIDPVKSQIGYTSGILVDYLIGWSFGLESGTIVDTIRYKVDDVSGGVRYLHFPFLLRTNLGNKMSLGGGGFYNFSISEDATDDAFNNFYGVVGSMRVNVPLGGRGQESSSFYIDTRYVYDLERSGLMSSIQVLFGFSWGGGRSY
jgi:hypothetical protein